MYDIVIVWKLFVIKNVYYLRLSTEEPEDMDALTKELEEVSRIIFIVI